ncbi:HAD-IC family P-type ATPase [Candidatus Uhrbacteria bacterium]|nr:HAD-IC family P-type ATPase [Candidatus Uhrbacteria bacterium]
MSILWHSLSIAEALRELKSSKRGLEGGEVQRRIKDFGPNELPPPPPKKRWEIFLNQFKSPLLWILFGAVGVSVALGEIVDAAVIFSALFINVFLGFYQEAKSEAALAELKKFVVLKAVVLRDGVPTLSPASELVPGDVIVLSSGDRIPADARLIEAHDFKANEAVLTGESAPVSKSIEAMPPGTPLAERRNMVYSGASCSRGRGLALVVGIGQNTELGKIAASLGQIEERPTPLQAELSRMGRNLGILIIVIAGIIFGIGVLQARELAEMFLTSVAVAVAAIPEGLPLAVTVILAIGMQKIFKQKALVRKLIAAETLGSVSVICTDKTGTITEGELRVSHLWTPEEEEATVHESGRERRASHIFALRIAALCNDALVRNPEAELKEWEILGDPVDKALFLASREAGLDQAILLKESPRVDEIPFDVERKYMATLHRFGDHSSIYMKGAPEIVLAQSGFEIIEGRTVLLTEESKKKIRAKIEGLARRGLRTLAVAYRPAGNISNFSEPQIAAADFIFVGVFGLRDPVRKNVADTIKFAGDAGIRTIMLTGDHAATARAVAKEVGIPCEEGHLFDGVRLDKISDEGLMEKIENIFVFARVEPRHKVRIVEALRRRGEVVAMTGDGVNDAPALKSAHIGIALGSGTEVAKEVSDLVLLDNNLKTIVEAVKQGRIIYDNLKKVVLYLLISSFSEVVLIAGGLFARLPLPVLPVQILWVNLVEDTLPNIALAFDPGDKGIMKEPPRSPGGAIVDRAMRASVALVTLVADAALLGVFFLLLKKGMAMDEIRTFLFVSLGLDSLFFVYVIRSLRRPFWQTNPLGNYLLTPSVFFGFLLLFAAVYAPPLQRFLRTVPLTGVAWTAIFSLAILKMFLIELMKRIFLNRRKN